MAAGQEDDDEEPPLVDDGAGEGAGEAAGALAGAAASDLDSVDGAELPPLPPRKSVTYQPEPLSWKPAAVTCLENVSAPHAGHVVS
jgi:hypothetical protein